MVAEHAGLAVRRVVERGGLAQAGAVLDDAEAHAGVPLVDEAERHRLDRALAGGEAPADWSVLLVRSGTRDVGYASLVAPRAAGAPATGDAAPHRGRADGRAALGALLAGLRAVAADTPAAARVEVWTRRTDDDELAAAADAGFAVHRRLGVLGRALDEAPPAPEAPDDVAIRAYRPGVDDEQVAGVLAAAYAGTDEEGWTPADLAARAALPWFRAEDLLVAEVEDRDGGRRIGGLHWLKRRDATTGEVYNLAIHPRAQGRGLGPVLLRAGLSHLRAVGLADVILWVDLANVRAVELYAAHGFVTRWQDVALRAASPRAS